MVNPACFRCSRAPALAAVNRPLQPRCVRAVITLCLMGFMSLGPQETAQAGIAEIYEIADSEEFQYRRLVDYAEAAGHALDAEEALERTRQSGLWDMDPYDCGRSCRLDVPSAVD
jgi:hypothetical protein